MSQVESEACSSSSVAVSVAAMGQGFDWGEDPAFSSYRKVFISQIYEMQMSSDNAPQIIHFSMNNRPVSRVEIVGIVRSVVSKERRIIITCDDGTGVIQCIKFLSDSALSASMNQNGLGLTMEASSRIAHEAVMSGWELGSAVSIRGSLLALETFRVPYTVSVQIKSIRPVQDSNEEILHWMSALVLSQQEYLCRDVK